MAILISLGNDIHIALSETNSKTTDECSTVTAEIIPHCRPAIWSRFHDELNAKVERVSRQESSTDGRVERNYFPFLSTLV